MSLSFNSAAVLFLIILTQQGASLESTLTLCALREPTHTPSSCRPMVCPSDKADLVFRPELAYCSNPQTNTPWYLIPKLKPIRRESSFAPPETHKITNYAGVISFLESSIAIFNIVGNPLVLPPPVLTSIISLKFSITVMWLAVEHSSSYIIAWNCRKPNSTGSTFTTTTYITIPIHSNSQCTLDLGAVSGRRPTIPFATTAVVYPGFPRPASANSSTLSCANRSLPLTCQNGGEEYTDIQWHSSSGPINSSNSQLTLNYSTLQQGAEFWCSARLALETFRVRGESYIFNELSPPFLTFITSLESNITVKWLPVNCSHSYNVSWHCRKPCSTGSNSTTNTNITIIPVSGSAECTLHVVAVYGDGSTGPATTTVVHPGYPRPTAKVSDGTSPDLILTCQSGGGKYTGIKWTSNTDPTFEVLTRYSSGPLFTIKAVSTLQRGAEFWCSGVPVGAGRARGESYIFNGLTYGLVGSTAPPSNCQRGNGEELTSVSGIAVFAGSTMVLVAVIDFIVGCVSGVLAHVLYQKMATKKSTDSHPSPGDQRIEDVAFFLPYLDNMMGHLTTLGVALGLSSFAPPGDSPSDKCINTLKEWLMRTASPTVEKFCQCLEKASCFNNLRETISPTASCM